MPYMSLFFDLKGDKGKYDYSNNNGNKVIMTMIIKYITPFYICTYNTFLIPYILCFIYYHISYD